MCKSEIFLEILRTSGSFAKFCDVFLELLCLKDPLNCTCLGVKLLHHYLFRVLKKKKNPCLGCQIPLLYLLRDANFSPRNTCLGCFLWVHGRAWHPLFSFEWPSGSWSSVLLLIYWIAAHDLKNRNLHVFAWYKQLANKYESIFHSNMVLGRVGLRCRSMCFSTAITLLLRCIWYKSKSLFKSYFPFTCWTL